MRRGAGARLVQGRGSRGQPTERQPVHPVRRQMPLETWIYELAAGGADVPAAPDANAKCAHVTPPVSRQSPLRARLPRHRNLTYFPERWGFLTLFARSRAQCDNAPIQPSAAAVRPLHRLPRQRPRGSASHNPSSPCTRANSITIPWAGARPCPNQPHHLGPSNRSPDAVSLM